MADMMRGTCSRGCCGKGVSGANPRPAEQREWQRDQVAGESSTPLDTWHEDPDEEWANEIGNYGAYAAMRHRDPLYPYGEPHYRPVTLATWERHERIRLRVEARRRERESRHHSQ